MYVGIENKLKKIIYLKLQRNIRNIIDFDSIYHLLLFNNLEQKYLSQVIMYAIYRHFLLIFNIMSCNIY